MVCLLFYYKVMPFVWEDLYHYLFEGGGGEVSHYSSDSFYKKDILTSSLNTFL